MWVEVVLQITGIVLLTYLVALQGISIALTLTGWREVNSHAKRRPLRDYTEVASSSLTLPVSILVPGYNEEYTIVESVQSLLSSQFITFELVIVNDGSKDNTVGRLIEAYDMVEVDRIPRSGIPAAKIKRIYASRTDPRITLIDKENGGKADALNTGINYSNYPLVCSIDADTLLDREALSRLVWEFQAHPETVAVGGIVRVINGSTIVDGKLGDVHMPKSFLARMQIVEYLRAFLGARVGWSSAGMLLIISGAFGLFRREAVVQAGGYRTETVGEDAELIVRLYKAGYANKTPAKVTFFPDPICWTEAPESWKILSRQRDRWQRGMAELLWEHKDMLFRKKYGKVGWFALPYFWIFELLSPVIEVGGYVLVVVGVIFGYVWLPLAVLLVVLTTLFGVVLSYIVILMEEQAFSRYPSWKDLRKLLLAGIAENFGYRQLLALVRLRAFWTLARGSSGWGEMTRKGFSNTETQPKN